MSHRLYDDALALWDEIAAHAYGATYGAPTGAPIGVRASGVAARPSRTGSPSSASAASPAPKTPPNASTKAPPSPAASGDGLLWNGDFRHRILFDGGLEWRIAPRMPSGAHASIGTWCGLGRNNALWLHFTGRENVNFSHVRKALPVEPGCSYRLRYRANALNISTQNGPYVKITVLADPPVVVRGQPLRNSGEWVREEEFTVPAGARWAEITICRDVSSKFDHRIEGDAWLDDFTLEDLGPTPQPNPDGRADS